MKCLRFFENYSKRKLVLHCCGRLFGKEIVSANLLEISKVQADAAPTPNVGATSSIWETDMHIASTLYKRG